MFCAVSLTTTFSFAQTNVIPVTGDVGIGTLTPSAKLDVNGRMNVDSMVVFKDSLRVQKKLIVKQDVKIQGKSVFVDNGKFKSDLKVLGVGRMKDKLIVDGLTRMNGDAKIFGDLKIKSLENLNLTENRFLTLQPNGKVSALNKMSLINAIYQPITPCFVDQNGNVLASWKQNPNPNYGILYTGTDCPARVGLGTNTPITTLDVRGSISMSAGAVNGYVAVSDANGIMSWKDPSTIATSNVWQINPANTSSIYFNTGNVGIGTTKTTDANGNVFMLSVAGDVRAESIEVSLESTWPDYIFSNDYELISLTEVEKYISKYSHLPDVPSAKDVKENGIDLGEMDAILLQKIEELTLYIIQQQKQIEVLQSKVKK